MSARARAGESAGAADWADDDAVERAAARAAEVLARPGAWLEAAVGDMAGYRVRGSADRRRRAVMALDEAGFRFLTRTPGLRPREEGGWRLARALSPAADAPPPGRPGVSLGEREVVEADGRRVARRVNLGESPLAWLGRRRDGAGRPWLTPVQVAAGERLREDFHLAGAMGRTTMSWEFGPRAPRRDAGLAPVERARDARARVDRALAAAGPGLREMLERVCLRGSALDAAERGLGLPRRAGKTVLGLALDRLAAHYGLL